MNPKATESALSLTQQMLARAVSSPVAWPDALISGVVPGGTLDAAGALEVYRCGYLARLTEQLGETYPATWRVLGDEAFFAHCQVYVAGHASTSYNLSDYGRDFDVLLANVPQTVRSPFLPELARLELLIHDLFHAAPHAGVAPSEFAGLDDLSGIRFRFGETVRVVACERAVYEVYRHRDEPHPPQLVTERPQWVLLFKKEGQVRVLELEEGEFAALQALAELETVEEALARAVERIPTFGAAEVSRLFEIIARNQLVVAIER